MITSSLKPDTTIPRQSEAVACQVTYLPESLEVEHQYVWKAPECDLLGSILLLVLAVWTVPRVLSVQLCVCVCVCVYVCVYVCVCVCMCVCVCVHSIYILVSVQLVCNACLANSVEL